jgi:endonuclease-3
MPSAKPTAVKPVRKPTAPKRARALMILDALVERFPDARCELDHDPAQPWQLLVAVVLSAQCTDVAVNKVTPALFAAFPDVHALARAEVTDVEPYIKTLGLFRNKAKAIVAAARLIEQRHGGVVPHARTELEALPGVGGKSAAVLVANCFGEPAIAVDTHVGRVSRRLGLTQAEDPDVVEAELTALWPRERLLQAHHTLIFQGRRICSARKPACAECPVAALCPRVGVDERQSPARPASATRRGDV